jgi:hypothetical protein
MIQVIKEQKGKSYFYINNETAYLHIANFLPGYTDLYKRVVSDSLPV